MDPGEVCYRPQEDVSHARVTRRKMKLFRKIGTQKNCGLRKELTVAGRRMTRRAGVAWLRSNVVRKDWTRNQAERRTSKRRRDGERLREEPECKNSIKDRGLSHQLRGKTGIKVPRTIWQLRLRASAHMQYLV
jgi:hypothetical protein